MSTILHITADYPDSVVRNKTPAVRRLIDLVPEHAPVVYSLNRVSGISGATIADADARVTSIVYRAPPYGLLLERGLAPVAALIRDDLARRGIRPSLVHAHKLTIEGIVADEVATALGIPLICSVWGNTDQKVIVNKPMMRSRFRAIAQRSHLLLPATPWAGAYAQEALALSPEKFRLVPVVSDLKPCAASNPQPNRIATLLHLDNFTGKNIPALIEAVAALRKNGRPVELSIYGGGSAQSTQRVGDLIRRAGCESSITLKGPLAHEHVQETLNRYAVFALPSRRETYGMVFIEALYAGVPILYPQGQAIDGFFDTVDVGAKCEARSVESIAGALRRLLDDEVRLKSNITDLHRQGFFAQFEPASIADAYRRVIASALRGALANMAAP